jgi:hypothetical protein
MTKEQTKKMFAENSFLQTLEIKKIRERHSVLNLILDVYDHKKQCCGSGTESRSARI